MNEDIGLYNLFCICEQILELIEGTLEESEDKQRKKSICMILKKKKNPKV